MSELKPCPFCGESDQPSLTHEGDRGWIVTCHDCGSEVNQEWVKASDAIAAWNTRYQPTCETCRWWESHQFMPGSKYAHIGKCTSEQVASHMRPFVETMPDKEYGCRYHRPREERDE